MTLDGEWHNEHGSKMILQQDGRFVRGVFHTEVGVAEGIYEVIGAIEDDDGPCRSIGLVVVWRNASGNRHSVTAWSGQLLTVDDEPVIEASWLLTSVGTANEWGSTQVGQDIFRRTPVKAAAGRRARPRPHPAFSSAKR
jgi:Avidin family